ncbi:MAG: PhoU domain-containing protein [Candidatus Thermoplasmatota archaeon]|nr:PhoU domain-containing protein [Candidatus Thermoplasmatota archaeon]
MELRKVQLTGGSSLTVTLPKAWADKTQLEAGDVVGCTEQPDGSLAVQPHVKGERAIQRYRIKADTASTEYLFRKIIAAYLMGYDAIEVYAKSPLSAEARRSIRKATTRIMGLEVIEEDMNAVTVQDFLDPKEFHVDKALRRMDMLTQAMQQEAGAILSESEQGVLASVQDRDDEVDRLFWLVNKQFHALLRDVSYAAKMELSPSQALNVLLVARLCERTADHAARIGLEASKLERTDDMEKFLEELGGAWRRACSLFEQSMKVFRSHDADAADKIITKANKFQEEQTKLLRKATDHGAEAVSYLAYIIESIGRTAAYAADIGEVAINHKVASAEN